MASGDPKDLFDSKFILINVNFEKRHFIKHKFNNHHRSRKLKIKLKRILYVFYQKFEDEKSNCWVQ